MVQVHFVGADGNDTNLELDEGLSLMEAAVRRGIDGIDADCGGQLACASCHVIVAPEWFERLPPAAADEREMLAHVALPTPTSRLSCQIVLSATQDGLRVIIPASQS